MIDENDRDINSRFCSILHPTSIHQQHGQEATIYCNYVYAMLLCYQLEYYQRILTTSDL